MCFRPLAKSELLIVFYQWWSYTVNIGQADQRLSGRALQFSIFQSVISKWIYKYTSKQLHFSD